VLAASGEAPMSLANQLGLAAGLSVGAKAQTNGDLTIHIKIHELLDQVRPVPKGFARNQQLEITLHNGNQVTERREWSRPDGQTLGQAESEGAFGSVAASGRMTANWRVTGQNSLVRYLDGPQHVETLRISVSGHTCTASVTQTLKPGFHEYERFAHGEPHFFSSIRSTVDSCVIE
jgi:hypothetical protein